MRSRACSSVAAESVARQRNSKLPRRRGREKQGEPLVVETFVDQPVERRVARHRHAGAALMQKLRGNSCMVQQGFHGCPARPTPASIPLYEADSHRGWASREASRARCLGTLMADYA